MFYVGGWNNGVALYFIREKWRLRAWLAGENALVYENKTR